MHFFSLGLNHQTAPLDLRESLAFSLDELPDALRGLYSALGGSSAKAECAIVSTCNRTELYAHGHEPSPESAHEWLRSTIRSLPKNTDLNSFTYLHRDDECIRHAFSVAAGLDSMVVGEPQILGQVKQAVAAARHNGVLGPGLDALFQRSFSVAKRVRSGTEIGRHSVSMAAATLKLAKAVFPDIKELNFLFVGAGEMNALVAAHCHAANPASMTVANRGDNRAKKLASTYGMRQIGLQAVPDALANADMVVSCTASPLPIIGLGAIEAAIRKRRHRPMVVVDLAVSRDVEQQVAELDDVFLYSVDDLAQIVADNSERRLAEMARAQAIVDQQTAEFLDRWSSRGHHEMLQNLGRSAKQWSSIEVEKALRQLAAGQNEKEVLDQLARRLSQKLLHGPRAALTALPTDKRQILAQALVDAYRNDPTSHNE